MAQTQIPLKRLKRQEKVEIRQLFLQGVSKDEIARRFDCRPKQITGIINTAKLHGRLHEVPAGFVQATEPAPPQAAPEPAPAPEPEAEAESLHAHVLEVPVGNPQPAPQKAPGYDPSSFGFNFTAAGQAGSLNNYVSQPHFRVERTHPPHGHLGTHIGAYDPEQLGQTYGSGTYLIRLRLPSDSKEYICEQRVSENYGPPKFPAREHEDEAARVERRDRAAVPGRPPSWGPQGPPDPYARDPYGRPYDWPRAPQPVVVGETAAAEAIRQMGELQKGFLTREAEDRKTGPSAFLQDLIRDQDARSNRMREEERAKEEERRTREETARAHERADRDDQWKRERDEAEDRHRREMDRLRLEEEKRVEREDKNQKFILDLEQKKIDLFRKDLDTRETALRSELDGKRKDSQREIDRTRGEMADLEKSVESKISEGKKDLEREHKLRAEMLEKEHALIKDKLATEASLIREKLDLERQIATANTTDSLVRGAKELVSELRKGIDSILDHKKAEMGLGPGNVTSLLDARRPAQEEPAADPAQKAEGSEMSEDFIAKFMRDPSGRQIVTEWARQVKAEVPPGSFLGFFMDGYQDPIDHAFRKQCRVFSVYIRTRDWKTMLGALEPHLAPDEKEAFGTEWADEFYEAFRACFFEEVDGYWKQVAERNASRSAPAAEPASAQKEAKG